MESLCGIRLCQLAALGFTFIVLKGKTSYLELNVHKDYNYFVYSFGNSLYMKCKFSAIGRFVVVLVAAAAFLSSPRACGERDIVV